MARDATRVELRIAQAHQHLLEKPYQERLKAALEEHFGDDAAARHQPSPTRPAARPRPSRTASASSKQAQAVAAIEQDPFVRELVENFDARVVESTIKPVE